MIIRSLAVTTAILLIFSAAHAASDDSLASAILNCSALKGEKAQIVCYNQIAAQLRARATLAEQSPAAAAPASPPQIAAQAPAAPSGKHEGSSWYDVGSWLGSSDAPPPARPMVGTPADFGKENMEFQADVPKPLDQITAGVANVTYNSYRRFTVALSNGQVWRQEDSDIEKARFYKDKAEVITVSRGLFGSFLLTIQGRSGGYKVRRIK